MAKQGWQPKVPLRYFFVPSRFDKSSEVSKARVKNLNLPILQYMYNGDESMPLKCLISGTKGWTDFPCFVTNYNKTRFNLEFNHIRQRSTPASHAGVSVDKDGADPSAVFRGTKLISDIGRMIEFMSIMPVSRDCHAHITQDSAIGDITLSTFPKKNWPWVLKNKTNFNKFCEKYNIKVITYDWMIDHLTNIEYPSIAERLADKLDMKLEKSTSLSKFSINKYRNQDSMFPKLFTIVDN